MEPARTVQLADGGRYVLRPITPDDKHTLIDGFARLSPQSRMSRFFNNTKQLTDEQLRYFTEIDYVDHFAWVVFDIDSPDHPGAGVARYIRLHDDPEVAEAAFTVVDDHQGRGLGILLVVALADVARKHGIHRFVLYIRADNDAMIGLARALGAHMVVDEPGVLRGELLLDEFADDGMDTFPPAGSTPPGGSVEPAQ
ncbi:MAG: GNAT family N-acetyltransferase [Actinobacteria bacterium]|nr:GNAT family N-acetyltransferase [Actinomycetota bacterium]MBV8960253.1 GNAT family N-acetyltransferase [Actinomycetota bacterium]MBV9254727.1 GNAT family N-acetyltransferase [Actinomycetota bacterium]MBV9662984.1 GNAT family N-acetyltransferase [Actinomycetota bacterium]MBV9933042.1 GNAT family N-acetyltransferase [Actinomycetota bacterium]